MLMNSFGSMCLSVYLCYQQTGQMEPLIKACGIKLVVGMGGNDEKKNREKHAHYLEGP